MRFVQILHADKAATYQTLPEAPGATGRPQLFEGVLEDGLAELEAQNHAGHSILITVNELDQRWPYLRIASNVTRVRASFVDLDGAPLPSAESLGLAPHLIVESSPGRYHMYWVVEDVPVDRFSALQTALAKLFGGDPAVSDLPRLMRVPGFFHLKLEPFRSRLLRADDRPAYRLDELLDGVPGLASQVEEVARRRSARATVMPRNAKERERLRRYASAALKGEVEAMRSAPDGTRHYRLPRSARTLGQFVASGALSAEVVETALRDAALAAGLEDRGFISRAIAWGLEVGSEQPRGLPFEEITFRYSGTRSSR